MKEKKEKETEPSPRQAQQSKPTHGFSKKKKTKQHRIKNQTYPPYPRSRRYRENQSPIH